MAIEIPLKRAIKFGKLLCASLMILPTCAAYAADPVLPSATSSTIDVRAIVEKADLVRFPAESFQVDVAITTTHSGNAAEERKYRVLSKGNANTIVMVTEPAAERGQIILMKERDLWIFMPDVSQPIRIALSQRLTGQVANGDLARANFAGDYDPKLLRTELIDSEIYYVLELNAIDKSVTYQKVIYWVRQKDHWPYKAEFYSLSSRLLKTCRYESFKLLEGRTRPTRLIMDDAIRDGSRSILQYSNMKLKDLPDKLFTKDYLKKLD
ncbi:outer membrane lipoprotein-sorting protein [Propionivibrio limicola]|uniref:outer membrane lipoprotein-sorting protein n=1 Tax=Propionivibrio limicola TaxID=167645 RepID=UPI0012912436|nr:outer membrane lipoprotein-sorting protein [Propionivibrio limicola]